MDLTDDPAAANLGAGYLVLSLTFALPGAVFLAAAVRRVLPIAALSLSSVWASITVGQIVASHGDSSTAIFGAFLFLYFGIPTGLGAWMIALTWRWHRHGDDTFAGSSPSQTTSAVHALNCAE